MLDTLNKWNELDLGYEYSGEHTVKNIIEPVRVYRVSVEPGAAGKRIGKKRLVLGRRYLAAVVIVLVIGAAAFWIYYMRLTPVFK
jgi:adenylate cyclase